MMDKQKKRKKQSILRLIVQCFSFAFHNGYVTGWVRGKIYSGPNKAFCMPGLNCYSCPGAIGACPIGSLQAVLDESGFHISLYVFGFIGAIGIFCGRFVCGWLCPFGLIQDLLYRIPFFKKIKNLPGHKYLRYLRFVILAVFVIALPMGVRNQAGAGQPWFCEYICPSGTLLGGIPLVIANEDLQASIGVRFAWKVFLLVVILAAALLSDRPFCKYICPLGALYGLANPVSIYRIKVDKDTCVECGVCRKVCGADIKVWENPNSIDCIRCGKCMAACPTESIYSTFSAKNFIKAASDVSADITERAAEETPTASSAERPENVGVTSLTPGGSKGRRIAVTAAGIICFIISAYELYQILASIGFWSLDGTIGDVMEFIRYNLNMLALFVPAVMTGILGIKFFKTGIDSKGIVNQDSLRKLCRWAVNTLIVAAAAVVFTYIIYALLTIITYDEVSTRMLTNPLILMVDSWVIVAQIVGADFIAWLAAGVKPRTNLPVC